MKNTGIMVVGGAGYIGSLVAMRLLKEYSSVAVLDDLSTGNRAALSEGIEFHEGDIGDDSLLEKIFSSGKIGVVMHFAAKIQVGESVARPDIYYRNNVAKPLVLLGAMLRHGIKKFVFSSTAAVFGNPEYLPIDERHPTRPINPYGRSKLMLEMILRDYDQAFGIKSVALRYFNAAGAASDGSLGESQKVKQNLIPIVLNSIEHNLPITVYGKDWDTRDGTCIRDYIHVEDLASAHLKAVEYLDDGGCSEVFNLGSGHGSTVLEVINAVRKATGRELDVRMGARREGDPSNLVSTSEKAMSVLGWEAVESGIENIVCSAASWHFNRRF